MDTLQSAALFWTEEEKREYLDSVPSGLCPECGSPVYQNPRGRHKKFCSDTCRYAWKNKHPNQANWKSTRTAICPVCGKEFRASREYKTERKFILVKGNHEDCFCDLITVDNGAALTHHLHNGTYETALQLTGYDLAMAYIHRHDFAEAGRKTPYYTQIIPSMLDYYETEHFIFVHGWIPCYKYKDGRFRKIPDWRNRGREEWEMARWVNGMDAAQAGLIEEGKTIVCGHWHCSYGHSEYEGIGSEFGPDADFSPYYAPGIIALDACTAHSGRVNVVVLED